MGQSQIQGTSQIHDQAARLYSYELTASIRERLAPARDSAAAAV